MKFMKLGSKPDTFYTEDGVRSVISEVSSDVVIEVKDAQFLLHKFPLLSKCGKLQKLAAEARQSKKDKLELFDFPSGPDVFEICAKFCYGITITLSALNIVAVRCAAEYLEMNEDVEKGNLIFKLEVFLSSSILRSWKDSIMTLKTTKAFMPCSEDLKLVSRCIDAIAYRASVSASKVDWSYTNTRSSPAKEEGTSHNSTTPIGNGIQSRRSHPAPKDWWVEDVAELEIDLYWRVMVAIKSTGRISHEVIGEALRVYAFHWLPGMSKEITHSHSSDNADIAAKHGLLLETVVSLLPAEKGSTSCSFLLKLLKAATILGASPSSKMELARRVGMQLEEASLNDLLIPSLSYANETLYDVDLVQTILDHFIMQNQSLPTSPTRTTQVYEKRRTRSTENIDFVESRTSTAATNSAKFKVAKLIDAYLIEIARDANLPISKFVALSEAIPDFARPVHDDLYRAIDTYLQEHPGFTKSERKRICRLLDCKKLSTEVCLHAAQNDRLPLRVVVQVLYFEQLRAAMAGGGVHELPSNLKALISAEESDCQDVGQSSSFDEGWDAVQQNFNALKGDLAKMKQRLAEAEKERNDLREEVAKTSKSKGLCAFPSKPRKILSKLWPSAKSGATVGPIPQKAAIIASINRYRV
ncbi:hypothetical protein SUGI_0004770 [Cryptomeria japonica]|nr:hypothetical protein SUGI_0004770 [Cryptomeria japonica]